MAISGGLESVSSRIHCRAFAHRAVLYSVLVTAHLLAAVFTPTGVLAAEGDVVDCTPTENVSQTEGFSSADPYLVADPTGVIHLFWAERVTGEANSIPNVPDAVMYSVWNGERWSPPTDLFLSPYDHFNRRTTGLRAVIDESRTIHLLWQGPDNLLFYSSVHADDARSARLWQEPQVLATDEAGSQYSAYLTYEAPNTLHVAYGRGIADTENRSVVSIRSTDNGQTWSEPIEIYRMPALGRGPSNVRLLAGSSTRLYATWTEWDQSGNGQAIYFARSQDSGLTWEQPVRLAERQGAEYERDWVSLATLGDDELVAFWEGGFRAYRQAQYSDDGGVTWSEPIDTLDWLIADNGFAEFIEDSAGRLHLFVSQRVREGNLDKGEGNAIWHTVWEGDKKWREPVRADPDNSANYIAVALSKGNEVHIASFSNSILEIFTLRCTIEGAPAVVPEQRVDPVAALAPEKELQSDEQAPVEVMETTAVEAVVAPTPAALTSAVDTLGSERSLTTGLIAGLVPTLLALGIIVAISLQRIWRR